MPAYDYACDECRVVTEVHHGMTEKPDVQCPQCDGSMRRVFHVPFMGHGPTVDARRIEDAVKSRKDKRAELRSDFGVHEVHGLGGRSFERVYDDIKKQGTLVKDRMQARCEETDRRQRQKTKEWLREAYKRVPAKNRMIEERRRRQEAKDRAMTVTSGGKNG